MEKLKEEDNTEYVLIDYKDAGKILSNLDSKYKRFHEPVLSEMKSFLKYLNPSMNDFEIEFIIRQRIINLLSEDGDCYLVFRFKDSPSQFFITSKELIS